MNQHPNQSSFSVQCNRGTFHDVSQNVCSPCPIGSFNTLIAQTICKTCPDFYSTRCSGSRQEVECRQLCPPGTFARIKTPKKSTSAGKTLMPFCRSCGIGEYQPDYDQTSWNKCPEGMTSDRGSKSIDNCYERHEKSCDAKTCGDHGKCIPSGVFYTCECDEGFYGQKCELKQDLCATSPCYNGATCRHLNETDVQCICRDGFIGAFCENINDPCNQKNCQN
jgi:Tyrosine-protein kinase ephrin type A/B receptor-like/EGF-like domain